jgi:hypothetical protein
MRTFIFSAVCLSTLVMGIQTQAQTEPCLTDAVHQAQIETSPDYARNFEAVREAVMNMRANAQRSADSTVTTLPVVVHVIHTGSAIGVAENISDAQITSAIEGMNDDFRKAANTPGDGIGVDTRIQFELAKRTPNGEPTNGIVRVDGSVLAGYAEGGIRNAPGVAGAEEADVKGLTTWYGEDYINIFVVTEINNNDGLDGTQGFAYTGPTFDEKDGIVVLYNAFGLVGELKPGRDMNRTITHEMGHHLSLYHTFYNTTSCSSETNCEAQGDEVCDTPPTRANNQGCSQAVCAGAQVENYMDYTPQECKNAFTSGQSERMLACLQSVRQSLLTSPALTPVVDKDLMVSGVSNLGSTTCLPTAAPAVMVTNLGTESVTGFELTTSLNDGTTVQTTYMTEVAPNATVEAELPEFVLDAENTFMFEVQLLGGAQDDFSANNTLEHRVDLTAGEVLTMTLTTYQLGHHIDWSIRNDQNEVLMSGGDYEPGIVATYVMDGCVAAGCHTLVMEDVGGDGMCAFDMGDDGVCDFGGTMSLTNSNGDVLAGFDVANSDFGSLATWEVCAAGSTTEGCEDTNGNGICDADEIAGCSDANACNFMTDALVDDGSCTYPDESYLDCEGNCLTDSDQDGVCDVLEVAGCTDENACNYDENATDEDGTCVLAETHYDCDGTCLADVDQDGVCDALEVAGCTDVNACNYNENATDEDGTCVLAETHYDCNGACLADVDQDGVCDALEVAGCTDMGANNYDPNATDDDDSCTFDAFGCMDENACNYNPFATVSNDNCEFADNHLDCLGACLNDADGDGICDEFEIPGCTDEYACNYDESATDSNGSCTFAADFFDCDGHCMNDADNDGICDELEVAGCNDVEACNFDANATDNDGSCTFAEELYDCDGYCLNDADGDGICDELEEDVDDAHGFETDNVGDVTQVEHVTLFPNPMTDGDAMVHLRGLTNEQAMIRVMGTDGRVVWQGSGFPTSPGVVGFPIRETVSAGSYLIQVMGTATISTMRLLIQ